MDSPKGSKYESKHHDFIVAEETKVDDSDLKCY